MIGGIIYTMKHIHIFYEDKEYKEIIKLKKNTNLNWHDFLLHLVRNYKE